MASGRGNKGGCGISLQQQRAWRLLAFRKTQEVTVTSRLLRAPPNATAESDANVLLTTSRLTAEAAAPPE